MPNSPGVIDSGYRGEIHVMLCNIDRYHDAFISEGERICQLVIVPFETCECVEVDELECSERGENGIGSTGRF